MKERFRKVVDGVNAFCYIKEQKKHWWSKWKAVMDNGKPQQYTDIPKGGFCYNETIEERQVLSEKDLPDGFFPKGDAACRRSMIEMIRNADEIYVGIMQDGKYYIAQETENRESLSDLQHLELATDED